MQGKHHQPLEGEPTEEFSSGQGESGNKAIDMLVFIAGETKAEKENAIQDEQSNQMQYESEMQASLPLRPLSWRTLIPTSWTWPIRRSSWRRLSKTSRPLRQSTLPLSSIWRRLSLDASSSRRTTKRGSRIGTPRLRRSTRPPRFSRERQPSRRLKRKRRALLKESVARSVQTR